MKIAIISDVIYVQTLIAGSKSSSSCNFKPQMIVNFSNHFQLADAMDAEAIKLYTRSIDFAAIKHRDQRRLDDHKSPYINHPIGVANILANEGDVVDTETLIAAILHDTVEDTDTTLEEIEEIFGATIRNIVAEVENLGFKKIMEFENASFKR